MKLNDPQIREHLIARLHTQQPQGLLQELRVGNGRAVADVVALFKEPHCYEIKGEADKLQRILDQGAFFSKAFRKVTLVTTKNHAKRALEIAPSFWGILVAELCGQGVKFCYLRGARNSPEFNPELALLTLWKNELISFSNSENSKPEKLSRSTLAKQVSSESSSAQILKTISQILASRPINHSEKSFNM